MEQEDITKTPIQKDNPLKELFIQYVGEKLNPENKEVTPEMCVEVLADEFPEFVLLVAQENFIRGYKQCIADMERMNVQSEQKQE